MKNNDLTARELRKKYITLSDKIEKRMKKLAISDPEWIRLHDSNKTICLGLYHLDRMISESGVFNPDRY